MKTKMTISWEKKYYKARAYASFEGVMKYLMTTSTIWMLYLYEFSINSTRYDILNLLLIASGFCIGLALWEINDIIEYYSKYKGGK